ncbi:hypothetical protein QF049_000846 [Paenibacillus sp. W4I10]|nr:hypothetical protein [Paenibacillus sp. W4I10]MDR6717773.1 hypothetical protein [Paenibacillus sp. 2003]
MITKLHWGFPIPYTNLCVQKETLTPAIDVKVSCCMHNYRYMYQAIVSSGLPMSLNMPA